MGLMVWMKAMFGGIVFLRNDDSDEGLWFFWGVVRI